MTNDPFAAHEALDRAHLLGEMVEQSLVAPLCIVAHPALAALAAEAHARLCQAVGEKT